MDESPFSDIHDSRITFAAAQPRQNQNNQNFPPILVPIGRDGKVIADHNKDNWNRHESIVFGSQLGLSAERRVKLLPGCRCRDHFALGGKNSEPDIRGHNRSEDRPNVDVGRAPAENVGQSPGEHGNHQHRECGER